MITCGVATVFVSDLDRAVAFYRDALGMNVQMHIPDKWAQLEKSGFQIGLHPAGEKSASPGSRGSISIGFYIDRDIGEAVSALEKRGVSFDGPVVDDGPVKLAFFGDPDDNELYLCQYSPGSH